MYNARCVSYTVATHSTGIRGPNLRIPVASRAPLTSIQRLALRDDELEQSMLTGEALAKAEADKAAASLDVAVGHACDPPELPGLASL